MLNSLSTASRSKYTALVVDDEPDVLEELKLRFEVSGYSVLTASSGNQAIELYKESKPDLVLTDLYMPNGGGEFLVSFLQEYAPRGSRGHVHDCSHGR